MLCVSSQAYQLLCDADKCNARTVGFENCEATGIPQLISYAKEITESQRANACDEFLNGFLQNMNSLRMWVMKDEGNAYLTYKEKRSREASIRYALLALDKVLLYFSSTVFAAYFC